MAATWRGGAACEPGGKSRDVRTFQSGFLIRLPVLDLRPRLPARLVQPPPVLHQVASGRIPGDVDGGHAQRFEALCSAGARGVYGRQYDPQRDNGVAVPPKIALAIGITWLDWH